MLDNDLCFIDNNWFLWYLLTKGGKMIKKLILSVYLVLFPFCVFAQPIAETDPGENTASPTVTTEERQTSKDEEKSLKDMVITGPQFPAVITTEEKEKKE